MDALLVQRVMFHVTGADIHMVAGVVQEYISADRAANLGDEDESEWRQKAEQIERCLRLYTAGTPISVAQRISGYYHC